MDEDAEYTKLASSASQVTHATSQQRTLLAADPPSRQTRWHQLKRAHTKALVAALEEDIQALQRQLEESELDRVYQEAQIATLTRLSDRTAAPAPAAEPVNGSARPAAELGSWRPEPASQPRPRQLQTGTTAECSEDGSFALDAEAAKSVASIVAAIRGPGQPHTTPASCHYVDATVFADLYQEVVSGIRELLAAGVEGSASQQQLERHVRNFETLRSLSPGPTLWRASPGLYYGMVAELMRRSVAAHGAPRRSDFDNKLAAMALSEEQQDWLAALAEALVARITDLSRQHHALMGDCADVRPPRPPVSWAAGSDPRATDLRTLVWEMQGVLQDYCFQYWGKFGAMQYARGLVATPFPLCSMSIGVHLMEKRRHPTDSERTAAMADVLAWLRGNEPPDAGLPDAGENAVAALFTMFAGVTSGDAAHVAL